MAKQTFKKTIRTIHLWLGLVSGLIVLIVALTGCMFVFEENLKVSFDRDFYCTPQIGNTAVDLDILKDCVVARFPKEEISNINFKGKPDAAYIFVTKNKLISVNPYNNTIIGVRKKTADFFTVVQEIHTKLYLGDVGAAIIKANVLVFFVLCLSGLILWWPKKWKYFKKSTTVNFKTKNKKLLVWNIHSVLGFYALIILVIIAFTGMFMAYDSVKQATSLVTRGTIEIKENRPKIKAEPNVSPTIVLQQLYDFGLGFDKQKPIETMIMLPTKKNALLRIAIRYPYSIARRQNTFLYDGNTAKLISKTLYSQYDSYEKVAMSAYNLHTGRTVGIYSKIVYFFAALFAASLPVTGFLIWRGKKHKKNKL